MGLRASLARRYAEVVDFKQYEAAIQKLLDTYVGAGEVETLVKPVDIFDKENFKREIEQFQSPEGQAEVIANRVRRAITEHLDEDPVFYERVSKLIDDTLKDYAEKRINQLELLNRMQNINDRVRERRSDEEIPAPLKDRDVAKSFYDVVRDQTTKVGHTAEPEAAAYAAVAIDDVIRSKRKVDWAQDIDVQNRMKTAIEEELFKVSEEKDMKLGV